MIRGVVPRLAAIALGLAVVVSPVSALPALATPSIPIPPPANGPQSTGTGKTFPSEVVVDGVGSPKLNPAQLGNGAVQYPISEEHGGR